MIQTCYLANIWPPLLVPSVLYVRSTSLRHNKHESHLWASFYWWMKKTFLLGGRWHPPPMFIVLCLPSQDLTPGFQNHYCDFTVGRGLTQAHNLLLSKFQKVHCEQSASSCLKLSTHEMWSSFDSTTTPHSTPPAHISWHVHHPTFGFLFFSSQGFFKNFFKKIKTICNIFLFFFKKSIK